MLRSGDAAKQSGGEQGKIPFHRRFVSANARKSLKIHVYCRKQETIIENLQKREIANIGVTAGLSVLWKEACAYILGRNLLFQGTV